MQSLEKPDLFPAGGARFLHDLNKDGPSTAELEECDFIRSRVVWIDLFIKGSALDEIIQFFMTDNCY